MKFQKRMLILLTAVLAACLLVGCGAESASNGLSAEGYDAVADATHAAAEKEVLSSPGQTAQATAPVHQKLIRTVDLEAETADMDALLSQLEGHIAQLGGYVENRSIYNGAASSRSKRTAALTVRIPAAQLEAFIGQVGGVSNVMSHNERTKDVTLSYVDTESRVKALETEEARLLELVAVAKDLQDLLTLEKRLTEIRTALEQHKSQLRVYDNQISYSTVYLSIREVKEFTVVEEAPEPGYFQRLGDGFVNSIKSVWAILKGLSIFAVCAIPYLILPAAVLVAILLPKWLRNRKAKKQQPPKP
jgi:hypothetical protein